MSEQAVRNEEARVTVNYVVRGPSFFGDNARGTVLPRWVAELSGSMAEELVANGTLEETDAPVVKSFRAPAPKADTDPAPAMAEELDRLRRESIKVAAGSKAVHAENEALKAARDSQIRALGELTEQVTHWRGVAEKHAARVAELEADLALERETRPAQESPAKGKKTAVAA